MRHAIIAGAGIAGPLAAIGLQEVGVTATVYEAYAESESLSIGAWLTVAVNGLDAMRTLGVHEGVKARGFPSEAIEFFSGTGRRLGQVPIGGRLADGTVTHTIKRADLYAGIASVARTRGIRIEYGRRLCDAFEEEGGVVARFEDGSEARGDFLVGADGVHSVVRRLIDPAAPKPRYTGLGNVGGFAPSAADSLPRGSFRMVFGKKAFFGYTVAPSGEVWWFANPPSSRELTRQELAATDWRTRLIELFSGDKGPMLDLIRRTPGPITATNQYELGIVPSWHRGRQVLIGDAAHAASPSSGQGVSMAAEDAVALGAHLRRESDTKQALAAFEVTRRERAQRVVAYGRRYASIKVAGPLGRILRDLTLPVVFCLQSRLSGPASLGWLFNHHIDWNSIGTDAQRSTS